MLAVRVVSRGLTAGPFAGKWDLPEQGGFGGLARVDFDNDTTIFDQYVNIWNTTFLADKWTNLAFLQVLHTERK